MSTSTPTFEEQLNHFVEFIKTTHEIIELKSNLKKEIGLVNDP